MARIIIFFSLFFILQTSSNAAINSLFKVNNEDNPEKTRILIEFILSSKIKSFHSDKILDENGNLNRIFIDFPNTKTGKGIPEKLSYTSELISSIRFGYPQGKYKILRVVLDLKNSKNYDIKKSKNGKILQITLTTEPPQKAETPANKTDNPNVESKQTVAQPVKSINSANESTTGKLIVRTIQKDAEILLNNELIGITPYINNNLPEGMYRLKLQKNNFKPLEMDIFIKKGDTTLVTESLLSKN